MEIIFNIDERGFTAETHQITHFIIIENCVYSYYVNFLILDQSCLEPNSGLVAVLAVLELL